MMRILSVEDVRAAITMRDAIEAVREGFIALSEGKAIVPVRGTLHSPDGYLLTMPSYLDDGWVVKIVGVNAGNRDRNLPVVHATIMVVNAKTGEPQAIMDGRVITAIRTGAASGLATDLLARPDAKVLGVIGAGVQARTQIEAVCAVRKIEEIRVYSHSGADKLVEELKGKYPAKAVATGSSAEALKGADVIIAATTSKAPVMAASDVPDGAHINGIGSFTAAMREIPAEIIARARVVVDHRAAAWAEAGDLIMARDEGLIDETAVSGELGELAAGKVGGRQSEGEITVFKSVGNAVQDNVVARRVLALAEKRGLGQVVDF
jgi:alanine dehydrogenase